MSADGQGTVLIGAVQRLKQGDLLRVCQQNGWTQSEMGRRLGLSPTTMGHFINMRFVPRLSDEAQRLIVEWTGKLPDELVPEWLSDGLDIIGGRSTTKFAEVGQLQLEAAMERLQLPSHESAIVERETMRVLISNAAKWLNPRELRVVEMRYGFSSDGEMDLEAIGRVLGLTRERVRQIEIKALSKMRSRVKPSDGSLAGDPKLKRLRAEQNKGRDRARARDAGSKHLADKIKNVLDGHSSRYP